MYSDIDGGTYIAEPPNAAKPEEATIDIKSILLKQDEIIKQQSQAIENLTKQVNALASRPAATPAPDTEKSPQDRAFEAMLKSYGIGKEESK